MSLHQIFLQLKLAFCREAKVVIFGCVRLPEWTELPEWTTGINFYMQP